MHSLEILFRTLVNMTSPTADQIETLLNFLEENRDLARGLLRNVDGRARSRRLWEDTSNTLNAMGGCTKTIKQWQKVWTDKKYLAKRAAAAARRSASATGGGPSTAPNLSQWELRVVSIMGDGFGEPQTTARVPAFLEPNVTEPSAALPPHEEENLHGPLQVDTEEQVAVQQVVFDEPAPSQIHSSHNAARRRQRLPRQSFRANSSIRERLFRIEEQRVENERQQNEELAGIRTAFLELCVLMRECNGLLREMFEQLLAKLN